MPVNGNLMNTDSLNASIIKYYITRKDGVTYNIGNST